MARQIARLLIHNYGHLDDGVTFTLTFQALYKRYAIHWRLWSIGTWICEIPI